MAWSPYNTSMGVNPLFGQADQASEDRNYNPNFYGYFPSVLFSENAPPFYAGDSLHNSVVQSPQPNWHTLDESTRSAFHEIDSHITDLSSVKLDNLEASAVDGVTEFDTIRPYSTSSAPSTDSTGRTNSQLQEVKHDVYQRPNQKRKAEAPKSFMCEWENCEKLFTTKGSRTRHMKTKHVSPQSFKCSHDTCDKMFDRKDNRDEHSRRPHRGRM